MMLPTMIRVRNEMKVNFDKNREKARELRNEGYLLPDELPKVLERIECIQNTLLDPVNKQIRKLQRSCREQHEMGQDKDMLCTVCGKPLNPNF